MATMSMKVKSSYPVTMRDSTLILVICMVIMLFGCRQNETYLSKADIIGSYEIVYKHVEINGQNLGKEVLTLKDNGTFEQTFYPSGGRESNNKGIWYIKNSVIDELGINQEVVMTGYVEYVVDRDGDKVAIPPPIDKYPEYWGVHWNQHSIWFIVNDDLELYYTKKR
ncbi:MAG: hypothetical protein WCO51_04410 [bacterium]